MKMQVKLYAEDGRRLWMNEYAVGLDVDAAIKLIDSELNNKLSSISSNTQKALSLMTHNKPRRVQLWNGKTVTVEKRKKEVRCGNVCI